MFSSITVPNSDVKHQELQKEFEKAYSQFESVSENKVPVITVKNVDSCDRKLK